MLDTAVEVKKEFKEAVVVAGDPEFLMVLQSQPLKRQTNCARVKDRHHETGGIKWLIYKTLSLDWGMQ